MTGSFWQSLITTATEVYEPNDGWGLAGLLIIGLPALITAGGTVWVLVRQRRTDTRVAAVEAVSSDTNAQVANGKRVDEGGSPLRREMEIRLDAVIAKVDAIDTKVDGIRDVQKNHGERVKSIEEHLRAR